MTPNRVDRRVQKTRRLLQDALVGLISEKGFEPVTIQEILDRANVGRSTFYTHFENKHELLHSCFEELNQLFENHSAQTSEGWRASGDFRNADFFPLFRFIEQNHRLLKALLGKEGIAMLNHPLYDFVFNYAAGILKKWAPGGKHPSLRHEMLAHSVASAFIGTAKWWVDHDMPCTAGEAEKLFKKFAECGIRGAFGVEFKPD